VTFWSVRRDGQLAGVGALKALAADHGEVKSMRTAPEALGRGVGRAMLHHIVAEARFRGYRRLSLETGSTEPFTAALRLYESEGFVRSGPFEGYRDTAFTRFFTREL
jgi:putative acetyltransferase